VTSSARPREATVLAHLERIVVEAERGEALVQDDGLVTDERDRRAILDALAAIRAACREVEIALGAKIID
jgi:hypothetical protein